MVRSVAVLMHDRILVRSIQHHETEYRERQQSSVCALVRILAVGLEARCLSEDIN